MSGTVVAIVLNYVHSADALLCVSTLARSAYRRVRIITVDNGSGSEAVEMLRRGLDPTVQLIESDQNLGYAAGNNLGLIEAMDAGAEFAWVVNPDVTVEPDSLSQLVNTANRYPNAGIIGSRILYGGSTPAKIWFDGGLIDWRASGSTSHLHMGAFEATHPPDNAYDVDYVTGAGMLLRASMLRQVGLIPEEWFLYFEETDFNLRARDAGWRTMVDPRSRLHHFQRSTGRLPQPYYVYYFVRNRYRFGMTRAKATPDRIESDLTGFVSGWREKVNRASPDWLPVFEALVEAGKMDGVAGRTGPRDLNQLLERAG